jgi:hypothetical protein
MAERGSTLRATAQAAEERAATMSNVQGGRMSTVVIIWIICAIIGAAMADSRGRSTLAWAIICGLTGIFGILALALAGKARGYEGPR